METSVPLVYMIEDCLTHRYEESLKLRCGPYRSQEVAVAECRYKASSGHNAHVVRYDSRVYFVDIMKHNFKV